VTAAETGTANRVQSVKDAIVLALSQGWERTPGKANSLMRATEHRTPERTPKSWWPGETYTACEWVSFLVFDGGARISAFHDTSRCPWVTRSDRKVSLKRALEILSDPALSDVHLNH
jgi:hypothetical protein